MQQLIADPAHIAPVQLEEIQQERQPGGLPRGRLRESLVDRAVEGLGDLAFDRNTDQSV